MRQQYELHTRTSKKSVQCRATTLGSVSGQCIVMFLRQDYSTEQLNCLVEVIPFLPLRVRTSFQSLAYIELEQSL
jgi:hypothetical protein